MAPVRQLANRQPYPLPYVWVAENWQPAAEWVYTIGAEGTETRRAEKHPMMKHYDECPECGQEFVFTIYGQYIRATREEPAEYPEIEIDLRNCEADCPVTNERLLDHLYNEGTR